MKKIVKWIFGTRLTKWLLRTSLPTAEKTIWSISKKVKLNFFEYLYSLGFKSFLWIFMRTKGIKWRQVKESLSDVGIARCFILVTRSLAVYGLRIPIVLTAPFSVVYNLTNRCNLFCKHCFQRAHSDETDHMTLEQKLSIIDQLDDAGTAAITFSGGEPLMSDDFFKVASYAYKKGIFISIDTNGTLVDKKMADKLYATGIRYAQISIDSTDHKQHDGFRGQIGAFNKSMKAAEHLSKIGIHLSMGVTLTKFNFEKVDEFVKLAKNNNFNRIVFYHLVAVGRGADVSDLDLTPKQRSDTMEKLANMNDQEIDILSETPHFGLETLKVKNNKSQKLPTSDSFPITAYFNMKPEYKFFRALGDILGGCPAGRLYANIQPNGDLTPCMFSPFYPVVGNLTKQTLKEAWNGFEPLWDRNKLKGKCGTCVHKIDCGGCRARPSSKGDWLSTDFGCDFSKYYSEEH